MRLLRMMLQALQSDQQQGMDHRDLQRPLEQARQQEVSAPVSAQGGVHEVLDRRPGDAGNALQGIVCQTVSSHDTCHQIGGLPEGMGKRSRWQVGRGHRG